MQLQNTLNGKIQLIGVEPYGGNLVQVVIRPAGEGTGIIFETTECYIKAKLDHASQSRSSILLGNGKTQVIGVEHILATLYAYGIDNALIELKRIKSRSFRFLEELGLAAQAEVVPSFWEREKTLCDRIEETGLVQQPQERKLLGVSRPYFGNGLHFEPIDSGLVIAATTDYLVPKKQEFEAKITPKEYRDELARSRPYAKHVPIWMPHKLASGIAAMLYPTFGIGHGYNSSNVFLPVKTAEGWHAQEIYPAEIARHTIVDRLGALALLDGRLEGVRVIARFSGHANDIRVLKGMVHDGIFIQQFEKQPFHSLTY